LGFEEDFQRMKRESKRMEMEGLEERKTIMVRHDHTVQDW